MSQGFKSWSTSTSYLLSTRKTLRTPSMRNFRRISAGTQPAQGLAPVKLKAVAVLRDHAVRRQQRAPYNVLDLAKQAVRSVISQGRREADAQAGKCTDSMGTAALQCLAAAAPIRLESSPHPHVATSAA